MGQDLESFTKHAKRSKVTTDDVLLCARRNDSLDKLLRKNMAETAKKPAHGDKETTAAASIRPSKKPIEENDSDEEASVSSVAIVPQSSKRNKKKRPASAPSKTRGDQKKRRLSKIEKQNIELMGDLLDNDSELSDFT
eukprot:TRINITY_DN19941_c0_g2_i1.p1 TRINITY_DN19941_c0_g2~~TRINITY_DN19941_c0_g2_i1.p1  ORF type:complete len:138 (-),score=38.00 TRINITY_DN19941_c0_g2_i1:411-824(-)